MKFYTLLLLTILFTKNVFSQTGKSDSLVKVDKIVNTDSSKAKRQDSIPYATLYFYRSFIPKMNAPIKKVPIYINDTLVYNLKANTIVSLKVIKEGKLNIAIDKKGESEMTIKVKFGNEYFFRCTVEPGLWFGRPTIEAVTPKTGKEESGVFKIE